MTGGHSAFLINCARGPIVDREALEAALAGSTIETFGRIANVVADNIARIRRGAEPAHRVI